MGMSSELPKAYLGIVQDTPAIACKEDVRRVANIAKFNLIASFEAEQSSVCTAATASSPDARVDVCLYLIEPHQLPEVDIEAIKRIGLFTLVVPLLAKVWTSHSCVVS